MTGSILPPAAADPTMLLPQDLHSTGPAPRSPPRLQHPKSPPLLVPEIQFSRSSSPSSTPPASPRFDHRPRGNDSNTASPVISVSTASSPLTSFTSFTTIHTGEFLVSSPSSFAPPPVISISSPYTASTLTTLPTNQRSVKGKHFVSAPILVSPPTSSSSPDSARSPTPSIYGRTPVQDPRPRPMSMSIDTAQWSHGPGSFPETIATGVDSTSSSISRRSSHEGDESTDTNISFVYANEKRFSDYHTLFRSVPDTEKLIEDYGCALQKEILVQGRLYISENHVCFNANIFGWVTNLVIAFSEITAIEKRMTAFVIPNAISIVTATNTKGHFFASFLSRDAAHDLLMAAWRKSFPCAANASVATIHYSNHAKNRSTLTIGDDDDDAQSFMSGRESRKNRHLRTFSNASQDDRNEWNLDDEEGDQSANGPGLRRRGSKRAAVKKLIKDVIAPIIPDDDHRNGCLSPTHNNKRTGRPRSVSELPPRPISFDGPEKRPSTGGSTRTSFEQDSLTPTFRPRAGTESYPDRHSPNSPAFMQHSAPILTAPYSVPNNAAAPAAPVVAVTVRGHARTACKCSKDGRHYANTFMTETYPGTVEAMWKLLFDSNFSKDFLTSEAMKGADVQEEAWKKTADSTSSKVTRYTRWLGMPIGPKTTKAILTDVCETKNFDDYTTTVTTTSTPDVPSGGSFTTKVRTCITWAGPSQVQIVVTGAVEFTKSSWIKGQIEKGAAEGLTTHYKELNKTLRKYIAAHPAEFPGPGAVAAPAAAAAVQAVQPVAASPPPVQIEARAPVNQPIVASEGEKSLQQPQPRSGPISKSKPVGLLEGVGSIFSKALGSFQTSGQEKGQMDGSQLALILVLGMAMLANVYIWHQISSVTARIEQIQGDLLQRQGLGPILTKQKSAGQAARVPLATDESSSSDSQARSRSVWWMDVEEDLREREYEEDVMWAWLTERQKRHRQYRRANGFYPPTEAMVRKENKKSKSKMTDDYNDDDAYDDGDVHDSTAPSAAVEGDVDDDEEPLLSETNEAKLQARIQQLQDQLLELERQTTALKAGTRAAELDREQDIPVEN
ncbi:hypothetical protein EMPS_09381 [Entomortierella parvispora]|uniref:VASt domain-containing protein n=1 Tax=Entomortierella parvispora TaxID=205924 RepID=A0A9P3HI28_9FUNG|nr:hypothetical protein EMPS_09381 [Entomortierella parvispora]